MILFATCLCCAGAVLSFLAHFSVLVAAVSLVVLAVLAGALLSLFGLGASVSLPGGIVVAVVALQVGYGLGVIIRACLRSLRDGHGGAPPNAATPTSPTRQEQARADS